MIKKPEEDNRLYWLTLFLATATTFIVGYLLSDLFIAYDTITDKYPVSVNFMIMTYLFWGVFFILFIYKIWFSHDVNESAEGLARLILGIKEEKVFDDEFEDEIFCQSPKKEPQSVHYTKVKGNDILALKALCMEHNVTRAMFNDFVEQVLGGKDIDQLKLDFDKEDVKINKNLYNKTYENVIEVLENIEKINALSKFEKED